MCSTMPGRIFPRLRSLKKPSRIFRRPTEPTVYRTLNSSRNGLARPSSGSGHLTYQIAGNVHHHVVCRICGGEVEVEHAVLENLYHKLESTSGYLRIDSHVTFFGICPDCQ
jgi:Fe2+ or Zn2+ uptake regulation protein